MKNRDSAFNKYLTFGIKNPVQNSKRDGVFKMTTTSIEKYKSNLYTLLFTGVGERVMEPEFGTIIKYLLFENHGQDIRENVKRDIVEKSSRWIPEINIDEITFGDELDDTENNKLSIKIGISLKLDESIQDFVEIEIGI